MTTSLYAASSGTFLRMLGNLEVIFGKAEAYAVERKFNPDNLASLRLAPDMHPLWFQVQSATDRAKLFAARVSGQDAPSWPDTERTWAEVKARLATGISYQKAIKPEQLDGQEAKIIPLRVNGEPVEWSAEKYLLQNALPNFYFHVTTAYDLLRHAGVPLGKRDFTG
ncbi:MAG: DUF1993 domain-containing protein [Devosia sp.]